MNVLLRSLLMVSGVLSLTGAACGSTLGTDNASNYTSWTDTSTGGTGFNAWSLVTGNTSNGGAAGFFLGDSTTLSGSTGGNINSSGKSFAMYANNADGSGTPFANASRSFAGGALTGGQDFSCDLAVNFRNGAKGIDIRDAGGNPIFTFDVTGNDYLVLNTSGTNGTIGNAYSSNSVFHLDIYQSSATGGTWSLTRSGGVTDFDTGTFTGDAASFKLFVSGTDGGDPNNLFANNFAISVPEPSTWLAGCLIVGMAGYRLSRSRRPGVLARA